jgi:hypothetical protein
MARLTDSAFGAKLVRKNATLSVTIANGAALSGEIDMRLYTMVTVHMPAAWTAARLAIQASPTSGGTFQPLYDELGNLMRCNGGANVVISTSYVVPPSVGGCRYIKLWSENGAGGNTNQGGDRVITVDLKA